MSKPNLLVLSSPDHYALRNLESIKDSANIFVTNEENPAKEFARTADAILFFGMMGSVVNFAEIFSVAKQVKWVHSLSAGVEKMLFPALVESPVPLTNARGVFKRSLAEFVVLGMLYFNKRVRRLVDNQRAAKWDNFTVEFLNNKVMGIVGYGEIGRECGLLAKPLGVKIYATRRNPERSANDPVLDKIFPSEELPEMLHEIDYLVAAAPLTPETHHLVSDAAFKALKPSAIVMNVGRGPVIDEAALIRALQANEIAGAALDVFEKEPLSASSPLWAMENVLISPHCTDRTVNPDWLDLSMQCFVANFERFTKGQPLENVVDKKGWLLMGVTIDDIQAAATRIEALAKNTPVMHSHLFDEAAGVECYFKCENLQRGGAFKIRGALNFLMALSPEERKRGVVTFSSGNHAQAVAIAAAHLNVSATIVMPTDTPKAKMESTKAYNPKIVLFDRMKENREEIAQKIAAETNAVVLPSYDHPWIVAGQGTATLEFLAEKPDLDAIFAPVGGGGLLSGAAIAAKAHNPHLRVFGVEPELANDWAISLNAGTPTAIAPPQTIADGLRTSIPGTVTFPIVTELIESVILVAEDEIKAAVRFLLTRLKILTEPSGAVPAAALLHKKFPAGIRKAGIILSGGNVDFDVLAEICRAA